MKFPIQKTEFRGWSAFLFLAGSAMVGGCLQTAPVVVVTPQDQAARLVYTCSNGKILDVTRVQRNSSALVVIDGRTVQLPRDTAITSAERYTNGIQTLTLFGNSASLVVLGRVTYGPCTIGGASGVPNYEPEFRRRPRVHDVD